MTSPPGGEPSQIRAPGARAGSNSGRGAPTPGPWSSPAVASTCRGVRARVTAGQS